MTDDVEHQPRRDFLTTGLVGAAGIVGGLSAGSAASAAAADKALAHVPDAYANARTSLAVRRVVTGVDEQGKSRVEVDELLNHPTSARAGHQDVLLWMTAADAPSGDGSVNAVQHEDFKASTFRITKYNPGVTPRNHSTPTLDYAIVLSGSITMQLEHGSVKVSQGDVIVQRATVHNWVNDGPEPCVVAFILLEKKT